MCHEFDGPIKSAFDKGNSFFKESLNVFWPTVGSRGFTEANQVLSFLTGVNNVFDKSVISVLMEVPFGNISSLSWIDGLALIKLNDTQRNILFLIEAKRIKENGYDHAYGSIKRDIKRYSDEDMICDFLKHSFEERPITEVTVVPIYLGDLWLRKKIRSSEAKRKWLKEADSLFPTDWKAYQSDILWGNANTNSDYIRLLAIGSNKSFKFNNSDKWERSEDARHEK